MLGCFCLGFSVHWGCVPKGINLYRQRSSFAFSIMCYCASFILPAMLKKPPNCIEVQQDTYFCTLSAASTTLPTQTRAGMRCCIRSGEKTSIQGSKLFILWRWFNTPFWFLQASSLWSSISASCARTPVVETFQPLFKISKTMFIFTEVGKFSSV